MAHVDIVLVISISRYRCYVAILRHKIHILLLPYLDMTIPGSSANSITDRDDIHQGWQEKKINPIRMTWYWKW